MAWRVLVVLAVLLAVGTIAAGVVAPSIVERALLHELDARGLPDARLDVSHVGLSRAAIRNIELDASGRMTAASLVATYSAVGLLRGEIETLRIEGARWIVELDEQEPDLGPVDALMEPRETAEPRARLPVRRIELHDAEVILEQPDRRWAVPLKGALVRAQDGFRVIASTEAIPLPLDLFLIADADLHVLREGARWSVRIDAGRVALESGDAGRLSSEIVVTGTATKDHVSLRAEQREGGGTIAAAGLQADVRRARVHVDADRIAGKWQGRGEVEVGLAAVVHERSGVRIERVAASMPVAYPLTDDASGGAGRVRVGPVRWRDVTLPAVRGEIVQRGHDVVASLRWPLTSEVAARGHGRIALQGPFAAELRIDAPPFDVGDAKPLAALVDGAVKGTLRGHVAVAAELGVHDGEVTQATKVELHDVSLTQKSVELHGVTGNVVLDSVSPPLAPVQRLSWEGGRLGKLVLGPGSADVGLRRGPKVVVAGIATDLGEDGESGRLLVGGFRWARGQTSLPLAVFAESLDLQAWLELLGRDEMRGRGTLHGHVAGTLHFDPGLRIELDDGVLVAEPGGVLELQDEHAAHSVLEASRAFTDVGELQELVRDRLVEALRHLRYSELRFELVPHDGELAMRVHLAGKGRVGAQQEIGGLTIFIEDFQEAVNEVLRLRGG